MNNYLCEYTGITRIVLKSPSQCGMISSYQEKEMDYDSNGRIAYNRGCGSYPPYLRIHCQRIMQKWRDKIQENRQELESQARGLTGLHRQSTGKRQKIKPATWLATFNKFTAVRFLSLVFQTPDKNRWKPLLIFSIRALPNKVKATLYKDGYVRGRYTHD